MTKGTYPILYNDQNAIFPYQSIKWCDQIKNQINESNSSKNGVI